MRGRLTLPWSRIHLESSAREAFLVRGKSMGISAAKRSLRLRASAEAFDVLRANGSLKISKAELLKHAVRSDHEPHPRFVREVHQAHLSAIPPPRGRPAERPTDSPFRIQYLAPQRP